MDIISWMPASVNIYDAKAQLSKLVAAVERTGQPVTICRNGVPVVDLVPHDKPKDPLRQDARLRGARYRGNPKAGVDEADWPTEHR